MRTLGLSLILLAFPLHASAQGPDSLRLGAHLAVGFGGDAEVDIGPLSTSAGLDPTVGAGLRLDAAVHEFVGIGATFEAFAFEADGLGSEREALLDFNIFARLRVPIRLVNDLFVEPYVALPFGLTIAVLEDASGNDEPWPGFNTGVLAGCWLYFSDSFFGFFLEAGWRHHQVFSERTGFGADLDESVATHQFALHAGGSILF